MPRVLVTNDNKTVVTWDERVTTVDFEAEHFRRQLSERLSWALADAEAATHQSPHAQPTDHAGPRTPLTITGARRPDRRRP